MQVFRVQGLGLGLRVQGLEIRVEGVGFRVQSLGFKVQGLGLIGELKLEPYKIVVLIVDQYSTEIQEREVTGQTQT